MTRRDQFAAAALQGLLASRAASDGVAVLRAVEIADAMLARISPAMPFDSPVAWMTGVEAAACLIEESDPTLAKLIRERLLKMSPTHGL